MRVGRGDIPAAQRAVGSALALALCVALILSVGFALFGRTMFAQIAPAGPVRESAIEFARPIFYGAPVLATCLTITNILRSDRRLKEATIMLLLSSAVNAVMNPILIHGYLGIPAMGVAGAGMATVVGFMASALLGLFYLRGGAGRGLTLDFATLEFDRHDAMAIARIALPVLATYVVTKGGQMALSILWARFGTDDLAAFGLATRLEHMLTLLLYGIGSAILTLGGEALGAGDHRKLVRLVWVAGAMVGAGTALLSAVLVVSPASWFELLGASPQVTERGVRYLQIAALSYPLYTVAVTLTPAYQTVGRAHLPLCWSVLRWLGLAVPVTAIVAVRGGPVLNATLAVTASMVLLGLISVLWLPRTLATVRSRDSLV